MLEALARHTVMPSFNWVNPSAAWPCSTRAQPRSAVAMAVQLGSP